MIIEKPFSKILIIFRQFVDSGEFNLYIMSNEPEKVKFFGTMRNKERCRILSKERLQIHRKNNVIIEGLMNYQLMNSGETDGGPIILWSDYACPFS